MVEVRINFVEGVVINEIVIIVINEIMIINDVFASDMLVGINVMV